MTKYELDIDGFCYSITKDIVYMHLTPRQANMFTDKELITSTADSITHEIMHKVINKEFNSTLSCLFDAIGYLFYNDYSLNEKKLRESDASDTWKHIIKVNGIQYLHMNYNLTPNDLRWTKYISEHKRL